MNVRQRLVRAVAAGLVAALGACSSAGAGEHALTVTGYIEQGSATRYISASASALTSVGVDGVSLTNNATSVSLPSRSMLSLLASAHRDHLAGDLLVNNYSNAINNFSSSLAAQLLSSQRRINAVAATLKRTVRRQHWNGVTIDLESLNASDARGLVDLVGALRHDLGAATTLSVDVGASTSTQGYVDEGFDLRALAPLVTTIAVMTYDQHGPWSGPGPIGALGWQIQCLRALLGLVPARRVELGVAGYGYTWPYGTRLHDGVAVSDAQARQMVRRSHAVAHWNTASGEWTAVLRNFTVLWWSDVRSFRLRLDVARRYHLNGVALWQLASCDPLTN